MTRRDITVFFDIGNVLLTFDLRRVAKRLALLLGRHPVQVARYLWDTELVERIERGEITPRQLYELFRGELGYWGSFEDFRRLWCAHFKLDPAAARLFARVASRAPTYLLSNTNLLHYDFIRNRYAFPRQARGAVLSYELGMRKPEPRIYRAALKLARAPAERCLFIDDLAENVEAARRVGMRALLYEGPGPLERDLKILGLL